MEKIKIDTFHIYYGKLAVPIAVIDKAGKFVYYNDQMSTWLNMSGDQRDCIYNFIHEDEQYKIRQCISAAHASLSFEVKWITCKQVRYVCLQGAPLEEYRGNFIVMTFQDITEQRQTQLLLHMKKTVLEMIVKRESLEHILRILSTEIEQQISRTTYCSVILLDESGEYMQACIAPNLPKSFSQAIVNVKIGAGVGSCGTAMYIQENVIVADIATNPIWKDAKDRALALGIHACWSIPILIDGKVVGSFALYHTETASPTAYELEIIETCAYLAGLAIERSERVDRLIEESEQKYKSLFEHNPSGIYSMDLQGRLTSFNASMEEILGLANEDILQSLIDFIAPEDIEKTRDYFQKALNGEAQTYEMTAIHKDGAEVALKVTNVPIIVQNQIVGMYGIAKDISEKKRTEELLSRSDKLSAIGQLAAAVAHEIRNPLTSIKGFIQFFRGNIEGKFVSLMLSELERIELIVNEFLLLAKPHATNFAEKDVNAIIHHTLTIIDSQALMNNVSILTSLAEPLSLVCCDENKLKQVFINILQNAIEAMPTGGRIHIQTEQQGDELITQVSDEGCGIPAVRVKKLGEPFYSNKEKGTGLGLMVCFKIIQEHQGRIEIESEEGKGTTVKIFLPIRTLHENDISL